jgi:predicted small secreted protein
MRSTRVLSIALLCLAALSACHTVSGVGKDMKSAGGAIQDASGKH